MNFRNLILLLCVSILFVNSFPIGKDNESEEVESETEASVETTTESDNEGTNDSQEEILEDQLNEVEEDSSTRKKRGLYSSERTEEEVEIAHGIHHREKRHAEHLPHPDPPTHVKRSSDHHRIRRSEGGHPHEKRSSPHTPEGHVAVMAKDDHHGHEKRNTDEHHGHVKRSADDHHGHQKRSEHVEHTLEVHDHHKRSEGAHGEHHLVKRSGSEGGHRHHRSTDQGVDEDEPEEEIQTDDTEETKEESETRKRRNASGDAPLPTFPSDHDASEHSNSPFE